MCSELGEVRNKKLIELLTNYNRAGSCPLKSNRPRRTTSAYFEHVHDPVVILEPPKRGELINASRKGFRINHTLGDAVCLIFYPLIKIDLKLLKKEVHLRYLNLNMSMRFIVKTSFIRNITQIRDFTKSENLK